MWTADFWKDLIERLVWTFVEAFLGGLTVSAFTDVDALSAALIAGLGAVLSALKSIVAAKLKERRGEEKNKQTAQLGAKTYSYTG